MPPPLRAATPLAGMFIGGLVGAAAAPSHPNASNDFAEGIADVGGGIASVVEGMLIGTVVGAVSASAIDASLLSRETAPSKTLEVHPTVAPVKSGMSAGVGGTF